MLRREFSKLRRVQSKLVEDYNTEFINNLVHQAVDEKHRYKPVKHIQLAVGDIVLLKEEHTKPVNYPVAIVRKVVINEQGEVTGVLVFKGKTRELVKRHVNVIIPLMRVTDCSDSNTEHDSGDENTADLGLRPRSTRRAARVQ
jgi:hypothetical protein